MSGSILETHRRWLRLEMDVAADIHPERWAALGISPEAAARLTTCDRSRRTLSTRLDWLASDAPDGWRAWQGAPDGDAANALLPGSGLWRIGLRFGASRHRGEVLGLIWRADIVRLKAAVGEDAYRFAVRQGWLVWRGTAAKDGGADGTLGERIARSAALGLACWLAGLPPGLAARTRMKLPPACDGAAETVAGWAVGDREAALSSMRRLFDLSRAGESE